MYKNMQENLRCAERMGCGMKNIFRYGLFVFMIFMLSACGMGEGSEEDIQIVESGPIELPDQGAVKPVASQEDGVADEEALNSSESFGGNTAEDSDENTVVSSENIEICELEAEPYEGEYGAYDTGEPGLEIRKEEDGTYQILVRIFKLASFNDGVGTLTEKGLEFKATAPDGSKISSVITLEEDVATVTFEPGWSGFDGVYSYQYIKMSNTPNMDSSAF